MGTKALYVTVFYFQLVESGKLVNPGQAGPFGLETEIATPADQTNLVNETGLGRIRRGTPQL